MDKEIILKQVTEQEKRFIEQVYEHKQEHLLNHWEELSEQEKRHFLEQINAIDFEELTQLKKQLGKQTSFSGKLEPLPAIDVNAHPQKQLALQKGEELLSQGKVACFVVAGGQGTRLGYNGPKGCHPITPVKHKSLFQVFAEKIIALQRTYDTKLPWYIMTSEATDAATKAFFHQHTNFGLEHIFFIQQGIIPTLDKSGKLLLADKNKILTHPNGHGGALQALQHVIPELKKKGIEYVFYFQVDNVLSVVADPIFLGYHVLYHADVSTKAVEKTDPQEKVGILAFIDGKPGIVEYSDMSEKQKNLRDKKGKLVFNAGNIAEHIFSLDFLETLEKKSAQLPFHRVDKKIFHFSNGKIQEEEAVKFETFIFDVLSHTRNTITLLVDRASAFAPLKNKEGEKSAAWVEQAQTTLFATWLEAAGVNVPRKKDNAPDCTLEISPAYALNKEDFIKKLAFKAFTLKPGQKKYFGP
ncbi:UTP--glucose-1-phosphate uridylyltransferase [Candidatus Woesearchaeota archaeon]|nr:UTP--glucose-1-phosphate uridylyltransferase [Candidatus Woesearchaeota archaeon]